MFAAVVAAGALLLSACGSDFPKAFADIDAGPPLTPHPGEACETSPAFSGGGDAPGVPYPTPAGATITPGITGIPSLPDARQVDSYATDGGVVQVYDTHETPDSVLAFYFDTLYAAGWRKTGATSGVTGVDCFFEPSSQVNIYDAGQAPHFWIHVSTAYIPRKGENFRFTPPPGYRGPAMPYAPIAPGLTRFWVVTPR